MVSRLEQSREDLSAQDQERTDAADPEEDGNGGEIQDGDSAQPQSGQDVEEDPERDSRIDQSRGQSDQMGEGGGTDQVSVGALEAAIRRGAKGLLREVSLFDIYRGKGVDEGKKSVAFNLVLRADDRSLTSEEADEDVRSILEALEQDCGAVLR